MSRDGDSRWIVQYEALLCGLNSKGQVMTWKLTPGVSFSDVEVIEEKTSLTGKNPQCILHRKPLLMAKKTTKCVWSAVECIQSLRARTGSPYVWLKFNCSAKKQYVIVVFAH